MLMCQNMDNNCVWNIFSQVVAMSQNIRHNRFCLRLAMKVSCDACIDNFEVLFGLVID